MNAARLFAAGAFVALLGATAPTPLLVTTRTAVVYVDGDKRQLASAGSGTYAYQLLSTTADGTGLVSFADGAFADVETIDQHLASKTIKTLPRTMAGFVAPADDGFLVYDSGALLMRRYDVHGSMIGPPFAASGAVRALGFGDTTVVMGSGQIVVYDLRGRPKRAAPLNGGVLARAGAARFAVSDTQTGEVRVYTTNLDLVATLRPARPFVRAIAGNATGALAILSGTQSCQLSDAQIELYDDVTAAQPAARISSGVGTVFALAYDGDTVYAINAPCRIRNEYDGSIAMFGRDGSARGTIVNVGAPTGVLPFPRRSP